MKHGVPNVKCVFTVLFSLTSVNIRAVCTARMLQRRFAHASVPQIRPRQFTRQQGKSRLFTIMVGSLMFLCRAAANNFLSVSNDE